MAAPFLLAEAEAKEEVFGLRAFGAIQGLVFTVGTVGGLIGPLFPGFIYGQTESYRLSFLILPAFGFLAVPLILTVRRFGEPRTV